MVTSRVIIECLMLEDLRAARGVMHIPYCRFHSAPLIVSLWQKHSNTSKIARMNLACSQTYSRYILCIFFLFQYNDLACLLKSQVTCFTQQTVCWVFSISGRFVWSLNSIDVVNLHFNDLIVPVEPLLFSPALF